MRQQWTDKLWRACLRGVQTEQEQKRKAFEAQCKLRATLDQQKEEQDRAKKREEEEREEARLNIAKDLTSFKRSEEQKLLQREREVAARKVRAALP